jgi:hypothetical protein
MARLRSAAPSLHAQLYLRYLPVVPGRTDRVVADGHECPGSIRRAEPCLTKIVNLCFDDSVLRSGRPCPGMDPGTVR